MFPSVLGHEGGGIVIDGEPLEGTNGIAGEWGHNPLPWPELGERPGPECYCGKRGCIETFLSGPGMTADHERTAGVRLSPEEIAARGAEEGTPEQIFGHPSRPRTRAFMSRIRGG